MRTRWLLVIGCLLCALTLFAQSPSVLLFGRVATPSGSWTDPSGANTLSAWWVHSDMLTNGWEINSTNAWPDRVSTNLLRNVQLAVNHLTNSALGIWDGTISLGNGTAGGLTNAPISTGSSNESFAAIFTPTALPNSVSYIFSPTLYDQSGADGFFMTTKFCWGGWFATRVEISGTVVAGNTYLLLGTQSGTTLTIYTNGVQSKSMTWVPLSATGQPWRYCMNDTQSGFGLGGYMRELFVWHSVLTSLQISNVHYYATNTYGFSP